MAVKVVIERRVTPGFEQTVWDMIRDLRREAVRQRGYLYGETWRSVTDPQLFVVVSAWAAQEHWQRWVQDEFRMKMDERIGRMLTEPSIVRIFEEMTSSPVVEPLSDGNKGG